jgi:hypothetical protein
MARHPRVAAPAVGSRAANPQSSKGFRPASRLTTKSPRPSLAQENGGEDSRIPPVRMRHAVCQLSYSAGRVKPAANGHGNIESSIFTDEQARVPINIHSHLRSRTNHSAIGRDSIMNWRTE